MEVLAVCCENERASDFAHVIRELTGEDRALRQLAMYLLSRADASQIVAAGKSSVRFGLCSEAHDRGLHTLVQGKQVDPSIISAMIEDTDPLARRYGAVAASRLLGEFPILMQQVDASDDAELREFSRSIRASLPEHA